MSSYSRVPLPRYFLLVFGMLAAIVPFAIDAYIPAIPTMAEEFGVDVNTMNQTISFFLIGYGFGQLFGGPLSDQVGRKIICLSGMLVFLVSTVAILQTQDIFWLKTFRFAQAIGGGFTSVIGLASIRDAYPAHEAGRRFAVVMMIMLIMPMLAPFLGQALLPFGWPMIFWALFAFVAATGLIYAFGIPETRIVPKPSVDLPAIFDQFKEVILRRNKDGIRVITYVFAMGFAASVLLIFVTNASYIYLEYFGLSPEQFPYYFGANVLLMLACIRYSMQAMRRIHPHRIFRVGTIIQCCATTILLAYLLISDEPALYPTFACLILCVGTMGLVNPNASAVYISHFDALSGSATSFSSMTVLLMGGASGAIVTLFLDETLLPIGIGMFIASCLCVLLAWTMPRPSDDFQAES